MRVQHFNDLGETARLSVPRAKTSSKIRIVASYVERPALSASYPPPLSRLRGSLNDCKK
uniref:Uncharacterized protein n=1 Tax=Vibrio owensii TaxID=696485 RepID=A0A1S6KSE5_9VIBR|nr:hypothetical protein [Vibrio owensii]